MHLALALATLSAIGADTIPSLAIDLLGETIEAPTYLKESSPGRLPFGVYASMPLPARVTPGWPEHAVEAPPVVGFARSELEQAVRSVEQEVYQGGFPGAALAIGRWDQTVVERGFGTIERGLGAPPVDPDHTIYDLASLTKVVATTAAVMLLFEDGRIDIHAPVSRYLPAFSGGAKDQVTIYHLLTHTSGLPAGASISAPTAEEALYRAISTPLRWRPGERVEYSDIGFITLWAAAEAAHGSSLEALLERRVYDPLDMRSTGFRPGPECRRCAPTEDRDGYRGLVHDPLARRLGGVAGHAGLFSTVHDLSLFASMLVRAGTLNGVQIFQPSTVAYFTRRQAGAGARALGWDTPDLDGRGAGGVRISRSAFGHTGFTGTSLWIDPDRGTWTVLLANRTFSPSGPNRMQALRRELNDRVATSIDRVD